MTREGYIEHYFDFSNSGRFFLVAFGGLFLTLAIILITSIIKDRAEEGLPHAHLFIESFYEMVFSSTSILFFLSLYYMADSRIQSIMPYWEKYHDVFLLAFIIASVFMTNWLDRFLVKLSSLDDSRKASIRLVSSFYIILILLYIRFIYENTNYNTLIIYFITLALGRFVYFDFTWSEFGSMVEGVIRHLPLLAIIIVYSGIVCWYGFKVQFLLKSTGVIVCTLIAHLFMDLAIFVVHHTRVLKLVTGKS